MSTTATKTEQARAWGRSFLKELQNRLGVTKREDLLVLSTNTDPFAMGTKTHYERARWFADVFEKFGHPGLHVRGVHYNIVGNPLLFWDGTPYENHKDSWKRLVEASRYARILGLVDPDIFEDKRNVMYEHAESYEPQHKEVNFEPGTFSAQASISFELPSVYTSRLYAENAYQPVHVEIWSEKSRTDRVALPIARQYGVNYRRGTGYLSITYARDFVDKLVECGKPGVILYLSDFDPAGDNMPRSAARHIEYKIAEQLRLNGTYNIHARVVPVALTQQQVADLQLPPVMLKEKTMKSFVERLGVDVGAEIDALEARHPGKLRTLIIKELEKYRDPDMTRKIAEYNTAAEGRRDDLARALRDEFGKQLDALENEVHTLREKYKLDELEEELQALDIGDKIDDISRAMHDFFNEHIDDFEAPDLPVFSAPLVPQKDDPGVLYDSQREYTEQLWYYNNAQRKR